MATKRVLAFFFLGITVLVAFYGAYSRYAQGHVRWVFTSGYFNSNAVATCSDGTVVSETATSLTALDSANGQVKWQFSLPESNEHPDSPIAVDAHDRLFFGSYLQEKLHRLYSIDGVTGKELWFIPEEVSQLAVGPNDFLFVGHTRLLALEGKTGHRIWDFQPPVPSGASQISSIDRSKDGHIQSIAYWNGMILVAFCNPFERLFALNAMTGKVKWSVHTNGDVVRLPITQNGLIIVPTHDGIEALEVATGHIHWASKIDRFLTGLSCGDGMVYAVTSNDYGKVYALQEGDGSVLWTSKLKGEFLTPPVSDAHGILYLAATGNRMVALDIVNGEIKGDYSFGSWWNRLPEVGNDIAVSTSKEGMAYVISGDHHLYAIDPPRGYSSK